MNYLIASTSPHGRVASRFLEEFQKAGVSAQVASVTDLPDTPDTVIFPRIAPEHNTEGVAALQHLRRASIINPPAAWQLSRDKAQAAQAFASHNVPTPHTITINTQSYDQMAAQFGSQFIVKVVDGTHGIGVHLVKSEQEFAKALQQQPNKTHIAQEFIAEAAGGDIRFIVVGDTVVAAMARQAATGDFRSNIHLGGQAVPYQPTPDEAQLAVHAAQAVGLQVAGVDCVRSDSGLLVLEVNPSPGLQIESITGVNVARAIAEYVIAVGESAPARVG